MKYTEYLRWGAVSALFVALLVPFIVAAGTSWQNFFFPYITGKNFLFRILVELALICYVLLALRAPEYRPRASMLMWAVAAFVGWMAIATLFAVDPVKSFWSNFERMEGYVGLMHLGAWFVMTGALFSTQRLWTVFFNASVVASVMQAWMAFFQAFQIFGFSPSSQSGARADTTFGNATYLAVYLLINFFITLYLFVRAGRHKDTSLVLRAAYIAAMGLQVCGILFTETRGAILGLLAGAVVFALYYALFARGSASRNGRRIAIGAIAALVVVGGLVVALRDTALIKETPGLRRLANISLTEITVVSRLQYIWPMAVKGALERPVAGWGQENFSYIFNKNYEPGMYNQEQWFDRAHNQFLDWLVAGGVPAFLLYTSFYALAAWAIWRSRELSIAEQGVFIGLLAGFAFNNLFVFDNLVSAMYFFALLAFFHTQSLTREPSLARPMSDQGLAVAAPIVLAAGLFAAWAFNVPGMVRAHTLVNAIQTQEAAPGPSGTIVGVAKDPKKNLEQFNEALGLGVWPGNPLGIQEVTEQLMQHASTIASQNTVAPQTKAEVFTTAKGAIERLLAERKNDARLELFAATLMSSFGQLQDSLTYLDLSLSHSPQKQQIKIQKAFVLLQAGSTQEALALLKEAYDSAPQFDQLAVFYAAGLYTAGQAAQADALLKETFGSAVVDNPQLLQVFTNLKLYDRAIAIWKLRVEQNPQDVEIHLGLASTYFAACKLPETLAELSTIAQLRPQAALEMGNLSKQIKDGTLKCGQ